MLLETTAPAKARGRRSAALPAAGPAGKVRKFLPEVQGLRAVAVLMVVAYHVWFGRISGGVDIFLLISSFLLTGQFVRKLESGRALELPKYWAHLFKRLLPLIAVTLLLVLGAARLFLPSIAWSGIFKQTWASLFYYQNWFLAAESVDYYATDHSLASPLQHFWSLSIQGQIFILWPLLFALAALAAKRWRLRIRPLLMYGFGAVFVVSLIFSIITTQTNQEFAYFDTRTRLWEFALGSLLALTLPYLRLTRIARIVMGWVGVVAMLSCGLILQVGQQFPGYMALWPTLAAAFIIVAGFTDSPHGADRFLSWKPLVKLGDSSYALYLLHWPILVIFLMVSDRQEAGPFFGLVIIIVSMVAAAMSTKYIDTPLRRNKWIEQKRRRAVTVIAVCVVLVAAPLTTWQSQIRATAAAAAAQVPSDNPGALTLLPGYVDKVSEDAAVLPALDGITGDWPKYAAKCEGADAPEFEALAKDCLQDGVLDGSATESVIVVGNSHAEHFSGAVRSMAEANNWKVTKLLGRSCIFSADTSAQNERCKTFNDEATQYILKMKPDRIVTIATKTTESTPDETLAPGYEDTIKAFTDEDIAVVGVRDNPRFTINMPWCADSKGRDSEECQVPLETLMPPVSPLENVGAGNALFFPMDMTDLICPDAICRPVIGNVHVYIDNNHVSQTYWNTMANEFARRLDVQRG
ncbi:acyltransferase family protein [Arthrobacter sp. H35-D1]|uniref:acyltransferase family protein n=1 Tax=Arthrobacter sp. H35-D1 TaxID=3046202 RepID=UPI0024B97448|nr:acyltransferase family protein [Arthrobacter sp. H35-D1]MDJ0315291.1 acyltransferase family protein [Arthrobacter sp. H35-D1]